MNWQETLEAKHKLEKYLKEYSMIYQAYYKEEAATLFDRPFDEYYDYPYELWKYVRQRMQQFYDAMSRDYEAVSKWSGKDLSKVPYCDWVDLYKEWLATL